MLTFKNIILLLINLYLVNCQTLLSSQTKNENGCDVGKINQEQFENWWSEMSIQKPIKCQIPAVWKSYDDEDLLRIFSKRILVSSYKCNQEVPIDHTFRGEIVDGQLRGSGKLKLGKGKIPDPESCLKVTKLLNQVVTEITGTFKGGVLHGVAKIALENGGIVIANFANGLFDGLRREWSPNGNLAFVGFYHKGAKAGFCFSRFGKI